MSPETRMTKMPHRAEVGVMLVLFMALAALAMFLGQITNTTFSPPESASAQLSWAALDCFLIWRVWRRGRIAWGILVALTAIDVAAFMALGALTHGTLFMVSNYDLAALLVTAAQLSLLLSPAVRSHVRRPATL